MKKKRFVAFLIDMVIIAFLTFLLSFFLVSVISLPNASMIATMFLCTFIICKDCYNGTSIGKVLMNIQIVNVKDQHPANPLKCVIRNYLYFIWIVEFIMFFFTKGRRLGGYMTCTEVIEGIKHIGTIRLLNLFITISVVILFFTLLYLYWNISSFVY